MSDFKFLKLKEIRKDHGLTQADMAKKIGIARTTYADYEKGRILPPLDKIKRICALFGLRMSDLTDIQDEQTASADSTEFAVYAEQRRIAETNMQLLDHIQGYANDLTLDADEGALLQAALNVIYNKYAGRCKR